MGNQIAGVGGPIQPPIAVGVESRTGSLNMSTVSSLMNSDGNLGLIKKVVVAVAVAIFTVLLCYKFIIPKAKEILIKIEKELKQNSIDKTRAKINATLNKIANGQDDFIDCVESRQMFPCQFIAEINLDISAGKISYCREFMIRNRQDHVDTMRALIEEVKQNVARMEMTKVSISFDQIVIRPSNDGFYLYNYQRLASDQGSEDFTTDNGRGDQQGMLAMCSETSYWFKGKLLTALA